MDAYFIVAFILVSCAHLSSQMLNEDDRNSTATTISTTPQPTAPVTVQTVHKNCTTATGVPGSCILRRFCNYGTEAIDMTLYKTRGFVRPCELDQACCPFEYQLPELPSYSHTQTDKDFEFDDED